MPAAQRLEKERTYSAALVASKSGIMTASANANITRNTRLVVDNWLHFIQKG